MMNDESTQGNDGPTTKGKRRWPKVVAGITAGCVMAVLLCPTLLMLGLADGGLGGTSARTERSHGIARLGRVTTSPSAAGTTV